MSDSLFPETLGEQFRMPDSQQVSELARIAVQSPFQPGAWVTDIRGCRWQIWGVNSKGVAIIYALGDVDTAHINNLTPVPK